MAARKHHHSHRRVRGQTSNIDERVHASLRRAGELIDEGEAAQGVPMLQDLNRRFPGRPDILSVLAKALQDTGDRIRYEDVLERILEADPDWPHARQVVAALAVSYFENGRAALGRRALIYLREHWPEDDLAKKAPELIRAAESDIQRGMADIGDAAQDLFELAELHDEIRAYLERGAFAAGREAAEELLEEVPQFAPALNNLALIYFLEGDLRRAIETQQRVLEFAPENLHALGNLARFHLLIGDGAEARRMADRMIASRAEAVDREVKIAETLSYLGDDEGVLEAYGRASRQRGPSNADREQPFLHHLAAVAMMRLGDEKGARGRWKEALRLDPHFALARENLNDLNAQVGERNAPWPFAFGNWVSQELIIEMEAALGSALRRGISERRVDAAGRRFVRDHPELAAVVPPLLDRGDPEGREFALMLASLFGEAATLESLREFAMGQSGPDSMRIEAANRAMEAGLLQPGAVRMWVEGEWKELLLLNFEIEYEAEGKHPPAICDLMERAILLTRTGKAESAKEAEALLKQALQAEPDAPDLLNNLAAAYAFQGRTEESEAIIDDLFVKHPDYLFARTNHAIALTRAGKTEEARELLLPLLQRKRLHISEMGALCQAEAENEIASDNLDAASTWLALWEDIDPENPGVEQLKGRIAGLELVQTLRKGFDRLMHRRKRAA